MNSNSIISTIPQISIITVSYNAVDSIEQTILSVINQNFDNYEYIIIDGGSNDGTLDIIKKYEDKITFWISEQDKGIYDAMNKGVKFAKGEWINFMNSGDSFYNNKVLKDVLKINLDNFQIIYGSINCLTNTNSFQIKPSPIEKILKKMVFCHQAAFVKKDILQDFNFNIKFKIAADFDLFRKLYINNFKFLEMDIIIANYEAETGVSSNNFFLMLKEYSIINGKWNYIHSKTYVLFFSFLLSINKYFKSRIVK